MLGLLLIFLVIFGVIYIILSMLESSVKDLITLDFLNKLKNSEEEERRRLEEETEAWERFLEFIREEKENKEN